MTADDVGMVHTWATVGGAIATSLAVVAALVIAIWGDWLRSLTTRPKLAVSITMKAPDSHCLLNKTMVAPI